MIENADAEAVVRFWSEEIDAPRAWFANDDKVDAQIRTRFEAWLEPAKRGDFASWLDTPRGALGLVILLDQFPRNLYRGEARSFDYDSAGLAAAEIALKRGHDLAITQPLRAFFYLPFEHSESIWDQHRAVALCDGRLGAAREYSYHFRAHRDVIQRFGRFPHRNACLGRASTPEEEAFLKSGGYNPLGAPNEATDA